MSNESRLTAAALVAIAGLSAEAASAQQEVYPVGSLPSFSGPDKTFTGQVDVQVAFPGDSVPYSGAYVTFQPGARTAWHEHPAGQHMVVTKGAAITATRDGQVVEFHEGEAVWCPQGVDHWHGATEHSAMTHFVVTGSKDGENVVWKDKVTDEQYQAALKSLEQPLKLTALSPRQQQMAVAIAFAASSAMGSLQVNLESALDQGVSVNELKEAFIHLYPYAGFPKSLNALAALMGVVESREHAGKKTTIGPEPEALPKPDASQAQGEKVQTELSGAKVAGPLFDFAPGANTFLQKHLFGDVFARGVLDVKDRELLTVAILASLSGTDSQLQAHIRMAKNAGVTDQQLTDLATLLTARVTRSTGARIEQALTKHQAD